VALRQGIAADAFVKDLTTLALPPALITTLQGALNSGSKRWKEALAAVELKQSVSSALVAARWRPPLRWRLDVTISTSQLQRVLLPAFLMRLTDKSGKERTFEVNPATFHKLRYNVARVLKEFDSVEKLPILKIDK